MLKEEKIYVPKDEELIVEIVWLHYDIPAAEHEGMWKMIELVMRNYWWPVVTKDVGKYMEDCDMYQRMKNRIEGKLITNEIPEKT